MIPETILQPQLKVTRKMQLIDYSVLFTSFSAGLLGSGHCFGMCGGIATGLGSLFGSQHPSGKKRDGQGMSLVSSALLFNLGRLLSYAILGLLSAWLLAQAGNVLNAPRWSILLRLLTALMIFLIGLQFLFNWQLLAWVERAGAGVWKAILPIAMRASRLPGGTGRLALGLCWGLLPCGLVYSILLTAATGGTALSGALIMLAFGLGTLPAMLGMSMAAPTLAVFLHDRWARKFLGIAMILLATLSVSLMFIRSQSHSLHAAGM